MSKRLVVNADDFGFTPDVNIGIIEAHRNGILSSTTLMANGAAFDDAIRLARENPALDVGCHVVLIGGRSILPPHSPLPTSVPELLVALATRRLRVEKEIAAQVRKLFSAGIEVTHLDTHKHTHLAPPVLNALARVAQQFGIRWIRRPFDLPLTAARVPISRQVTARGLGLLRGRFHRVIENHHCRTTDYFAGFQITGRFRTAELVNLIQGLPSGITELMCHPGYCREDLQRARTRLKASREYELEALIAPATREAVIQGGIQIVSYRDL